jgi:type I site-specific restriction endonuclease
MADMKPPDLDLRPGGCFALRVALAYNQCHLLPSDIMPTPEQLARQNIDALSTQCGWIVQSRAEMNLGAGRGIAVREFPLKTGYADYLLFVDRRAIGAIEAKAERATLTGVEAQAEKYSTDLARTTRTLAPASIICSNSGAISHADAC